MTITPRLDLETLHLEKGSHDPDSTFCIMEAIAFIAGEPWSDSPTCASPVIAAFLRTCNDSWNDDERQQLKRFILPLIGSAASPETEQRRAYLASDRAVRVFAALALDAVGRADHAQALRALEPVVDEATAARAARAATEAARAARAAARAAPEAAEAPEAAAWAAARAARAAARAAPEAARAAAEAARAAAEAADRQPVIDFALQLIDDMLAIA